MKHLSPIILFVYNRPFHTERLLKSLSLCTLANQSKLFVICDGPKMNASQTDLDNILSVRTVVKSHQWCGEVEIVERKKNVGLDLSVISSVTDIVNLYDRVIVLEDDLLCHSSFLLYMNKMLEKFESANQVLGISGYSFVNDSTIDDYYFLPLSSAWGWATWKSRWMNMNFESLSLIEKVNKHKKNRKFNFGSYNYLELLNSLGGHSKDPWDIRVYANLFLKNGYYVFPNKTLIRNLGFDGAGVHCQSDEDLIDLPFESYIISDISIKVNDELIMKIEKQISSKSNSKKNFIRLIIDKYKKYLR